VIIFLENKLVLSCSGFRISLASFRHLSKPRKPIPVWTPPAGADGEIVLFTCNRQRFFKWVPLLVISQSAFWAIMCKFHQVSVLRG
jgi:hypothetical protein